MKIKYIFLKILLLVSFLNASSSYLNPDESNLSLSAVETKLLTAQKSVKIITSGMQNFTLTKALKKLTKKEVKIEIIYSQKLQNDEKSSLYFLSKYKNIQTYVLASHKPLLINVILIDDKYVIFQEHNFSLSSFYKRYTSTHIFSKGSLHKKYEDIFTRLKKRSKQFLEEEL